MYNVAQQKQIARELARAGGSVDKAAAACREEYETLDTLSPHTIRNLLRQQAFQKLLKEQEEILNNAENRGIANAEELRARQESFGRGKLRRVTEDVIDSLHKRVTSEPSSLEAAEMLRKYIMLHERMEDEDVDEEPDENDIRPEDVP